MSASPLTIAGSRMLLGEEQTRAAEQARLDNPANVAAREQSGSAYEGLSPEGAQTVVHEAFAGLIDEPAGGPPSLADGQKAVGFPSDYAMAVETSGGKHVLVESLEPLALETAPGKRVPLNLSLHEVEGGFQAASGIAPVRLPQYASEGAKLLDSGVSLSPVSEAGSALGGGKGVIDGASVFYGDTEDAQADVYDLSMLAKPTVDGFELFSTLLSQRSPEHLFFKVGMPSGATLTQEGSGTVRVLEEGRAIASIPRPLARDAEGTVVPVSISISNGMVELTVARKPGEIRYPLFVDPHTIDENPVFPENGRTNWKGAAWQSGKFREEYGGVANGISMFPIASYVSGEWVDAQYETQHESKIYEFEAETSEEDTGTQTKSVLESVAPSETVENWGLVAENNKEYPELKAICAVKTLECLPSQGSNGNLMRFIQRTQASGGSGAFEDNLYKANLWISQEKAPTIVFNTTSPMLTVEGHEHENVMYPGKKAGWDLIQIPRLK